MTTPTSDKKKLPKKVRQESFVGRARTMGVRSNDKPIRLNKLIADAGIASRRNADELILNGKVTLNGIVVRELGMKVDPLRDRVLVNGKQLAGETRLVYVLLNKPKDCITTSKDERGRFSVLDLIKIEQRIFPVGRLDRNTTGALILTNDGDLAFRLTHPRFGVFKTYHVVLTSRFSPHHMRKLTRGMMIDDEPTTTCQAEVLDPPTGKHLLVRLHEGKNRQIHRMFETLGYSVEKLERVDYAGITTEGLKRGEWRFLFEHEVRRLRSLVSRSADRDDESTQ